MPDPLHRRRDSVLVPELTTDGLVLWRLRDPDYQLWCTVEDFAGQLALRVYEPGTGRTAVVEAHTVASVVGRADELRIQFVAEGWERGDVDLDEPG